MRFIGSKVLLLNHINSEKRDSLNGHSPYEVSRILLDNKLFRCPIGMQKNMQFVPYEGIIN